VIAKKIVLRDFLMLNCIGGASSSSLFMAAVALDYMLPIS
jgi:hypothetical protein